MRVRVEGTDKSQVVGSAAATTITIMLELLHHITQTEMCLPLDGFCRPWEGDYQCVNQPGHRPLRTWMIPHVDLSPYLFQRCSKTHGVCIVPSDTSESW